MKGLLPLPAYAGRTFKGYSDVFQFYGKLNIKSIH
jgi:hypothetical protein